MATTGDADVQPTPADELGAWFDREVPDDWFSAPPAALVDRDEIMVIGTLACPKAADEEGSAELVQQSTIAAFREQTREERIEIARRGEALFGRKISWVARCGSTQLAFTTLSVPVMTRLRLEERLLLDTLVGAGVARSRSDALAWCVRLVAGNQGEWIGRLRAAISEVDRVRAAGPEAG